MWPTRLELLAGRLVDEFVVEENAAPERSAAE